MTRAEIVAMKKVIRYVLSVFQEIGGVAELVRWARKNRGEFYALAAMLIPVQDILEAEARRSEKESKKIRRTK